MSADQDLAWLRRDSPQGVVTGVAAFKCGLCNDQVSLPFALPVYAWFRWSTALPPGWTWDGITLRCGRCQNRA